MRKIIINKDNKIISTIEDWFEFAPPEGKEKQWKDKHSAKELARYFINNWPSMPVEIDKILDNIGVTSKLFLCEPERETDFVSNGLGYGKSRQHDILLMGNDIVIGLEAKATENLDKYVLEKFDSSKYNHHLRYDGICNAIIGKSAAECDLIRYQLLSATMGTLLEAKKSNIKKAMVLIIVFESDITTKEHTKLTEEDVEYFKSFLTKKKNGSFSTPYAPDIDLYIEMITVSIGVHN